MGSVLRCLFAQCQSQFFIFCGISSVVFRATSSSVF